MPRMVEDGATSPPASKVSATCFLPVLPMVISVGETGCTPGGVAHWSMPRLGSPVKPMTSVPPVMLPTTKYMGRSATMTPLVASTVMATSYLQDSGEPIGPTSLLMSTVVRLWGGSARVALIMVLLTDRVMAAVSEAPAGF